MGIVLPMDVVPSMDVPAMGIVPPIEVVPPVQGSVLPVAEGTEDGAMETTGGGGLNPAGAISTEPKGMPVPEGGGAPVPAAVKLDPAGGVMPLVMQESIPLVPTPPPSNMGAGDWPAADPMPGQAAVPLGTEPIEVPEPAELSPCTPSSVEPRGTPTAPMGGAPSPRGVPGVMPGVIAGPAIWPAPMVWACTEPHSEMRVTRRTRGERCDFMLKLQGAAGIPVPARRRGDPLAGQWPR
jgi:hypothetical protein